jgi:hypothetical protein
VATLFPGEGFKPHCSSIPPFCHPAGTPSLLFWPLRWLLVMV